MTDPQLELSILANCFQYPKYYETIAHDVKAEYFATSPNRDIFTAIADTFSKGMAIDIVSVVASLRTAKKTEAIEPLSKMQEHGLSAYTNREIHTASLKDYWVRREVKESAKRIVEAAEDLTANPVADMQKEATTLSGYAIGIKTDSLESIAEKVITNAKLAREYARSGIRPPKSMVTFDKLDRMNGYARAGNVVLLAARPSHNKSTVARAWCVKNAALGNPCLFFSTEMTTDETFQYMAVSMTTESGVPNQLLSDGMMYSQGQKVFLTDDHLESAQSALDTLSGMPINLYYKSGFSIQDIEVEVRRWRASLGETEDACPVVFVDYFQQIRNKEKGFVGNKSAAMEDNSERLKALALSANVCIVVVCALSRAGNTRSDPRPIESDLRGCGTLEYDADIIYMLFYPHKHTSDKYPNWILEILTRKFRRGGLNSLVQCLTPNVGKIRDLEPNEISEYESLMSEENGVDTEKQEKA